MTNKDILKATIENTFEYVILTLNPAARSDEGEVIHPLYARSSIRQLDILKEQIYKYLDAVVKHG